MKSIFLNGAALMTLAGAIAFAAPADAQSSLNPPQYSSPEERQQTQQLNEENLNGTSETPAQLNGQAPSPYNSDAYGGEAQTYNEQPPYGSESSQNTNQQQYNGDRNDDQYGDGDQYSNGGQGYAPLPSNPNQYVTPDNSNGYGAQQQYPDAQQQQYNEQMQQYQDQQQDYQNQRQQYQNEKDRYRHDLSWYDQQQWAYDYPRAYAYEYDEPRLERLSLMAEPSQQLANVPIEGPNGEWVGRVRNIETAPDGRPARVEVALNRRVSVWVDPRALRFDPSEGVLYTNMTRRDLWQMPGATVESGPL